LDGGSVHRKAAIYTQNNTTQNKCTETSMPRVGFEPTTPVLEQEKMVHTLGDEATVISSNGSLHAKIYILLDLIGNK
jgi:hypothetical protein